MYKTEQGSPRWETELEWNLSPDIPADAFGFEPPAGAMRVEIIPHGELSSAKEVNP